MNHLLPRCAICGKSQSKGLRRGLQLAGKFICSHCEQELVTASPLRKEYEQYVQAIKKVLYG